MKTVIARPVSENERHARVLDTVLRNLEKNALLKSDELVGVSVVPFRKHFLSSKRWAALISIEYERRGSVHQKDIWAKTVGAPETTYRAMVSVYNATKRNKIEGPIPEPFFFSENEKLVFMEAVRGRNLLRTTLIYSSLANSWRSRLSSLYYDIGNWLQQYHFATSTGEWTNLSNTIEETRAELENTEVFSRREKEQLSRRLFEIAGNRVGRCLTPIVIPHNDFTLRNISTRHDGSFSVLDWDAMIHPAFPQKELCWWDLTTVILNLQSLLKIHPLVNRSRLKTVCDTFLEGYFDGNQMVDQIKAPDFLHEILFVFALRYWLNVKSDRPMWRIYNRHLGRRYVMMMRRALLEGRAYLL